MSHVEDTSSPIENISSPSSLPQQEVDAIAELATAFEHVFYPTLDSIDTQLNEIKYVCERFALTLYSPLVVVRVKSCY
jgi:hypothetical protein